MQVHWHLSEKDFFKDLPQAKEEFLSVSTKRCIKRNEFIFYEEDPGERCYYLDKGTVKIFRTMLMGKEPIFFVRNAGEMFGLAEVMEGKERKANAQAITPCVYYEIGKEDFEALLSRNYPLAHQVIAILGRRLRYLSEQVANLMACDVTTRLVKFLIYLSYQHLSDLDAWDRPVTVPINLTQEQIAACTGSCQQTVSETLKKLQEDGLIFFSRKEIILLKPRDVLDLICH